ncbi:hypothetical protein NQ011_05225 [Corynebacterium phoceense]|uniref:hypothetical protein n=1 Tax=Corynebacterium phoceense TaxID=1686286 RepID=UPI00211C4512|nr:hypothetical protein [Corynebacterium phoceense]MCQ9336086.1 hypothetical protein [Corynebacterium phoceense]
MTAGEADAIRVLGAVSRLSCGTDQYHTSSGRLVFEATCNHGDSGAPAFALKDRVIHPVGTMEGHYEGTLHLAVMPLDQIMPALHLDSMTF